MMGAKEDVRRRNIKIVIVCVGRRWRGWRGQTHPDIHPGLGCWFPV